MFTFYARQNSKPAIIITEIQKAEEQPFPDHSPASEHCDLTHGQGENQDFPSCWAHFRTAGTGNCLKHKHLYQHLVLVNWVVCMQSDGGFSHFQKLQLSHKSCDLPQFTHQLFPIRCFITIQTIKHSSRKDLPFHTGAQGQEMILICS